MAPTLMTTEQAEFELTMGLPEKFHGHTLLFNEPSGMLLNLVGVDSIERRLFIRSSDRDYYTEVRPTSPDETPTSQRSSSARHRSVNSTYRAFTPGRSQQRSTSARSS